MGIGFGLKCKECDYEKRFKLGIGIVYSPRNICNFDSEFGILPQLITSKKTLEYVKSLIKEKDGVIPYTYEHKIYHCSKCNEVYERFYFQVSYDSGTFEPDYKCTKCKISLNKLAISGIDSNLDLTKYICPKCGKQSLEEDSVMILWD